MNLSGAIHVVTPILAVAAALALLRRVFGDTWRGLDEAARREQQSQAAAGSSRARAVVALTICATVLTVLQYGGDFAVYREFVRPILARWDPAHSSMHFAAFEELYARTFWEGTRLAGFVLVPLAVNAVLPKGLAAPLGLGLRGLARHAWIAAALLAVALPLVWVASRDARFNALYPSYRDAGRSGLDLLLWEVLYLGHFLALEIFFRGWLLSMLRGLGSAAIFALTVPYCMLHYVGKPYTEAMLSIAAGVALGSLAARTRSVWLGFVVHATTALTMDVLALAHSGRLPRVFWPQL
jgi:Type II CAAX prenyl endopeptidase Rce1-like